jgi:hypothetical protein
MVRFLPEYERPELERSLRRGGSETEPPLTRVTREVGRVSCLQEASLCFCLTRLFPFPFVFLELSSSFSTLGILLGYFQSPLRHQDLE